MSERPRGDPGRAFYRRWVAANGVAEAVGLGTTFTLGWRLAPLLAGERTVPAALATAAGAVVAGIALEGLVVGWAQAVVLRRSVADLPRGRWVVATALGAGLAWTVGMVPSTVMALEGGAAASAAADPALPTQAALAVALGAVTGPLLGFAQWLVLRRHAARAARWLGANALAWAAGMPLIFAGMGALPWAGPPVILVSSIYAVCGLAGATVGAIHGVALLRLTASPASQPTLTRDSRRLPTSRARLRGSREAVTPGSDSDATGGSHEDDVPGGRRAPRRSHGARRTGAQAGDPAVRGRHDPDR